MSAKYDSVAWHEERIREKLLWQDEETIHIRIYTRNYNHNQFERQQIRIKTACERLGLEQTLFIPIIGEKGQLNGMHYWYVPPEGWIEENKKPKIIV